MRTARRDRPSRAILLLALLVLGAARADAQDPATLAPGLVLLENARVRVLAPSYAPGEGMAMHEHPPRVVVFMTDAKVEVTLPDGTKRVLERKAGAAETTPATKHAVKNVGGARLQAIEVELRTPAGEKPLGDAVSEDPKHVVLLVEDDRVKVHRTRLAPGESTPMHGHGERVTIILSGGRMKTAVEGAAATESDVPTGDVSYRLPTRHVATNVGTTLHDAITVELKPAR